MVKVKENDEEREISKKKWHDHRPMSSGWLYGLGFIGAVVYYIQQSDTFWMGVLGVLKAIVWPAMLIYKIFTLLNM